MKKKALIAMLLACSFAFGTVTMTACDLIGGGNGETKQEQGETQTVAVTGVDLNKPTLNLKKGATEKLSATVSPSNATNKSVSWQSGNTAVATVDNSGNVTAVAVGSTTITVKTADGNKTASCTVTVTEDEQQGGDTIAVTGVTISKKALNLTVNGTETLTATVAPANASNRTVTWSSGNTAVATVSGNGLVTAKSAGTATITVTTADGSFTDACTVTVSNATVAVTGVLLDKTTATAKVDETVKLTATVNPANASNKTVTWSSGNAAVASVDNNGVVTGKSVGTATITVTTADGNKTATCTVTVEPKALATVKVTGVQLDKTTASLKINSTVKLTETVAPANASNKAVTWQSGNTAVATVDQTGLVTAVSAGSATITVKTADGNFTATCAVTVQQSATDPVVDAKISYAYAGNECAAFEWAETNAASANVKVEYKLKSANSYTALTGNDKQYLIRQKNANTARVDLVGLKGGAVYDFKITPSSGAAMTVTDMTINSYDRSGYAHFGKSDGVGAYKDDGTVKSNARIIYLTEANKNNIDGNGTSIAQYLKNAANNSTPIIVRVVGTVGSATWNLIDYGDQYGKTSLGKTPLTASLVSQLTPRITDNKTGTLATEGEVTYYQDSSSYGYKSGSGTLVGVYNTLNLHPTREDGLYDTSECAAIKGLNSYMKVKSGEYDSCWNDCPISNVSNVTIEGIGEDAEIFQWGFTFKNSSSIEVRNIHFDDYTEDACSFEGNESSVTELSAFKSGNIWLHHNTFDEGMNYWDVCAEQDKGDGDGSTDFKGLKNITIAYNHYIETHKTGLIGGSDSVSTANVTFHHNYYESCNQRMPLGRQANMHMYNNYYSASTLYSISLRAGAYAFIENCYFTESASNRYPVELVKGSNGTPSAKIIGCVIDTKKVNDHNDAGDAYLYIGNDRNATVNTSGQRFAKNFDTDSSLFYYKDGKSDVSVMFTAEETKTYVPQLAGVQKRGEDVTLGGSGSGSGTGSGTETPDPTPSGALKNSATVVGAKSANSVLLEVKNGGSTVAKVTLVSSGTAKSGGTLVESDGSSASAEGHIQVDAVGALSIELAAGYTYSVTVYAGSSSNEATRDITIDGVTHSTGIGAACKALTWNLNAGTYTSTESGKIRIAKIVITATPV